AADPAVGLLRPLATFEGERPRHDPDGEGAPLLGGELAHDRRTTRAGASTLARRHEDHVGALERLFELVAAFLRGSLSDGRIGACAETSRRLRADVDLDVGVAHQ